MAGVEAISLSFDGAEASRHDGLRGVPGCFDRTLAAARECAAAGLPFQVNTLVSEETLDQLPAIHRLVAGLGAVRWSLFFLVDRRAGNRAPPDHGRSLRANSSSASSTSPRRRAPRSPRRRRRISGGWRWPALGDAAVAASDRRAAAGHAAGIRDGNGIMFISNTGEVHPSGFLPLSAGNVKTADPLALYRDSDLFRALRRADGFGGRCGRCEYRETCGGSRARAWAATGDPLAEDPLCLYEPAAAS